MSLPRVSLFQSAIRMHLTYGVLPTREQFEDAFEGDLGSDGVYQIRNCKRVGNSNFTCAELWAELNDAVNESQAGTCEGEWADDNRSYEQIQADEDAAGDWASAVLQTLGIEWV
jgi:hypothetical protein